jgi:hypothetical protein
MRNYLMVGGAVLAVSSAVVYMPACSNKTIADDDSGTQVCQDAGNGQGQGCACDPNAAMWAKPRSCYEGPPGTLKAGTACKSGTRTCSMDGFQSDCSGQVLPTKEICDTIDNDCNGVVDDISSDEPIITDFSEAGLDPPIEAGAQCYVNGQTGLCAAGRYGCNKAGMKDCLPLIMADPDSGMSPYMEICNNIDDDCDGVVDNVPENGQMCMAMYADGGAPKGECAKGKTQCTAGVETCVPGTPAANDICDGKDNNCNGKVDEMGCNNGPCPQSCTKANNQWCCVLSMNVYCEPQNLNMPWSCYQQ